MKEFAKFMVESNTATKLLQRITNIGNEAVDNIMLLLPLPEFPDDAIKIKHPFSYVDTVNIKKIYLNNKGEVCFEWYGGDKGVAILDRYNAEDRVWLLRSIVEYLTK